MKASSFYEAFVDPPAAYRPMIFWLWNGEITREGIAAQIADFAAHGCGGFFLHPMGEHFRLTDFIRGISPPYLSDEYFALVRYAVETAASYGLYVWLYDEGGWPSGTAQGHVTAGHPEWRGQRLHAQRVRATLCPPQREQLIAAVGLPDVGVPQPIELAQLAQGLCPYEDVILFTLQPDGYPVDILNPQAVRRFIEVTHEPYAATVGEFFGETIPGIFTDETSLGGRVGAEAVPWTGGLLEELRERMGREPRQYLPLLFAPEVVGADVFARYSDHEIVAARCEYYEAVTQRFSKAYWRQLRDWCAAHGLRLTGHVGGEDNLPDHLHFGHFFRTAGTLHIPGIDVIWRQLFPGQPIFPFVRFASSALAQRHWRQLAEKSDSPSSFPSSEELTQASPNEDENRNPWENAVLTESNAVYGFGLTYGQMRWLLDIQVQQGINLYAPMAYYYTTSAGRLYGTMSHWGPGHPLWPYYRPFADYVGRLCWAARQGIELVSVAVYYPVEALWTIAGAEEAWRSLQEICHRLQAKQIPFHFIDADTLAKLAEAISSPPAGKPFYTHIFVPAALTMPAQALSALAQLHAAGLHVVFLEHWPLQPSEMKGVPLFHLALEQLERAGVRPLRLEELKSVLAEARSGEYTLHHPEPNLGIRMWETSAGRFCFLTNNSARTIEPLLEFDPAFPAALEIWDLRDGERIPLPWKIGPHAQEFQPILPPWSSILLFLRRLEPAEEIWREHWPEEALALERWLSDPSHRPEPAPADVVVEFDTAQRAYIHRQYVIEEGNIRVRPEAAGTAIYGGQPVPLWDWADWPLADFSGEIAYEFEFVLADELAYRPLLLDLGQVFWTAQVELNEETLGTLLWAPYLLDVTGRVRAGTNRLRIIVANTLANQACRPDVEAEARARGWLNPYLQRALPMMREDLRSGLYGPVRLLVGVAYKH